MRLWLARLSALFVMLLVLSVVLLVEPEEEGGVEPP